MDEQTSPQEGKEKHHAWIRYLNTNSGEHYQDYIRARNESNHESRICSKDFERTLAAETKTNNKGFWKYVNWRRKTRTKIADLRTTSGAFTSDDLDKADILNQQYANTFTVEDLSSPHNFRPRQLQTQPLETVHITEEIVHKKLQSLRSDKSPGPDNSPQNT